MGNLKENYKEELSNRMKIGILVGMLDKEFQDAIWERGAFNKDMTYEQVKSYALNLAQKRIQRATPKADHGGPTPMDTSQVSWGNREGKGWDYGYPPGMEPETMGHGGEVWMNMMRVLLGKGRRKGKVRTDKF